MAQSPPLRKRRWTVDSGIVLCSRQAAGLPAACRFSDSHTRTLLSSFILLVSSLDFE